MSKCVVMASSKQRVSLSLQPLDTVKETDTDSMDCGPSIRNRPVSPKYATFGDVGRSTGSAAYTKSVTLEDEKTCECFWGRGTI